MIGLIPSATAQDTTAAFTILALAVDPDATKKRLEQLVEATMASQAALKAAQDAEAKANAATDKLGKREAALEEREAAVAAREQKIAEKEAKFAQANVNLDKILKHIAA